MQEFVNNHYNACVFTSLGQLRYFSCLAQIDCVVGNSSSGLLEAPAFSIGTVNIGDRQKGRLQATSIIDCEPYKQAILCALERVYSPTFQQALKLTSNPYGSGGASENVAKILADYPLDNILKKQFYNLPTKAVF